MHGVPTFFRNFVFTLIMNMNSDFRKYATKHLGMNGLVLDEVVSAQAVFEPLYPRGASVERDTDGCVLTPDDGPHHLPRYTD